MPPERNTITNVSVQHVCLCVNVGKTVTYIHVIQLRMCIEHLCTNCGLTSPVCHHVGPFDRVSLDVRLPCDILVLVARHRNSNAPFYIYIFCTMYTMEYIIVLDVADSPLTHIAQT